MPELDYHVGRVQRPIRLNALTRQPPQSTQYNPNRLCVYSVSDDGRMTLSVCAEN